MPTFNTTENQANTLFPVRITYGAKQNEPQTLSTPPSRDQLKVPKTKHMQKKSTLLLAKTKPSPTKTQPEPSYSSLLKVGIKRRNESSNHGYDDAKRFKVDERKIQTGIPTVETEVQPC